MFLKSNLTLHLAVETTRHLLQRGLPPQCSGLATQTGTRRGSGLQII
jgi:hypothetical protein